MLPKGGVFNMVNNERGEVRDIVESITDKPAGMNILAHYIIIHPNDGKCSTKGLYESGEEATYERNKIAKDLEKIHSGGLSKDWRNARIVYLRLGDTYTVRSPREKVIHIHGKDDGTHLSPSN